MGDFKTDILDPPDVMVTYSNVTEGDIVVMTCEAAGVPQFYTFGSWLHLGPDRSTVIREFPGNQNSLILYSVTYQDSGYYTCTANNGIRGRSPQIVQRNTSGLFEIKGETNGYDFIQLLLLTNL